MASLPASRPGMPTGARSLEGARRRVPWNVLANIGGFLVNVVLTVFITARLVHGLGVVGFGIWGLIGHIAGNMNLLDFGMQVTVIRYLSRHHALDEREKIHEVVSSALAFSLLPAALAMLTGTVVAVVAPALFHLPAGYVSAGRTAILLVAASIALAFPGGVLNSCIPALSRYDLLNLRNICWSVLRVGLLWWVLDRGYGLVAVAVVCLVAQLAALVFGGILALRLLPWLRVGWRYCTRPTLRSLCSFSFWAFLLSMASRLIFTADNVVVAIVLGPAAVAFYSVGGSIAEQLRGGMATITMIYAPLAAQMHALRGSEALRRLLCRGSRAAVLVLLPGVLAFAAVGKPFLGFWLGSDYALRTTPILILLSLSATVYALAFTCNQVLFGMNRHRISAWISLGEAAANLGLSIVLAFRLGAVGVAWGTLIPAVFAEAILLPVYTCRLLDSPLAAYYREALGRPVFAALPLAAWLIWIRSQQFVQGWVSLGLWLLPGLALYALSAWIVAVDPEERELAMAFLRRGWRQVAGGPAVGGAAA